MAATEDWGNEPLNGGDESWGNDPLVAANPVNAGAHPVQAFSGPEIPLPKGASQMTPAQYVTERSYVGRILDAMGQSAKDGFGDAKLGVSDESEAEIEKLWGFGDQDNPHKQVARVFQAFHESFIRPAAWGVDLITRSVGGAYRSVQGGLVAAGVPKDFVSIPDAFMGSPEFFTTGARLGVIDRPPMRIKAQVDAPAPLPLAEAVPEVAEPVAARPQVMAADEGIPKPAVKPSAPIVDARQPFDKSDASTIDKAGNIRLDNLNKPEDVKQVFRDTAAANDDFIGVRGNPPNGVISLVDQAEMADALGLTIDTFKAEQPAGVSWSTWTMAVKNLAIQSAENVATLMRKAAQSGSDEDLLAYAEAKARHQMIQEEFSKVTAEGGRTLAALRKDRAAAGATENIGDFLSTATGKTLDELRVEARLGSELQTPAQVSKFLNDARKATTGDMVMEAWVNGLLSSPITHVVNTVSNTVTALWNVPETLVAAGIGKVRRVLGTKDESVMFGEAGQELFGIVQGAKDGVKVAARALMDEEAPVTAKVDLAKPKAIPGIAGRVIRTPSNLLTASDELFKAVGRRQVINRLAYRRASEEGLRGDAHATRTAQLIENPTDEMRAAAEKEAAYQTFTNPLGTTGKALQSLQMSNRAMRLILTFVRTPVNMAKYSLRDRTPLGVFSREIRKDLSGENGAVARDTAIARMAVGTAVGVTAVSLAARGLITGGGPKDARQRALLYATGWQPYSVKIGNGYYSYSRVEPLATLLGVPADMYEIGNDSSDTGLESALGMVVASVAKNAASKTSLTGLADLVEAVEDPDRYGRAWIAKMAGTAVPNVLAQAARVEDPYLREARTITDTIKSRVPFLRETLLPRRDIWGEPIKLDGAFGPDLVSPIYETQLKNDPVNQALLRIGYFPSTLSRKIGGVQLSDKQYDDYQRIAGRLAHTALVQLVGIPSFALLPAFTQRETVERTVDASRAMARQYLQLENNAELTRQGYAAKIQQFGK